MAPKPQWFEDLSKTLRALAKGLPKNEGKKLDDALDLATIKSQEGSRPSQAVTSMDLGEVHKISGLQFANGPWKIRPQDEKPLPPHVLISLAEYDLVVEGSPQNESLARIRIDLLFIAALAARKTAHRGASEPRESFESLREYRSLHMQVETRVHLPWKYKGKLTDLTGKMDYSLWYGEDPTSQESNLVVVEAKSCAHNWFYQAICYMAMLHHARKSAGRSDTTIWGIATDGKEWKFIRLNADSTINFAVYSMHQGESSKIFGMICMIVDHAAGLSPVLSRTLSRGVKRSLEDESGIQFLRS